MPGVWSLVRPTIGSAIWRRDERFVYNLGGVLLGTAENPAPNAFDGFGSAIAALDERRFVIGAPYDDTAAITQAVSMATTCPCRFWNSAP
jgi:hypothetical protein